jgi:peptidyl-prolyl cis-trans isomerase D
LWALQPGQVSDPIRTQFGVHLIQLVDIQHEAYPDLAKVKDELRTRLVRQHADELYAVRLRRLEELAFEVPDSLDAVKNELGLEVKHTAGVTRRGGSDVFTEAPFREAAFAPDVLERGLNSGVVEHNGIAVALRVRTRHESVQRPLEDVIESVRAMLVDGDARQLARTKAEEARGRLAAGESVTTVADAAKVDWKVAAEVRRQTKDVPSEVLTRAFEVPRPAPEGRSIGIAELPEGVVAVVVVTRVIDGDYAALTDVERRSLDRELLQRAGNVDLTSVFETVREESSIRRI